MGRCLIVANQTLGGQELDQAVRDRIERGDDQFHVVVPMTASKHETPAWTRGFAVDLEGLGAANYQELIEEDARRREAELATARERAEDRLTQMLEQIRTAGGQADGEVGDADPALAVKHVLEGQRFDEVIVSTLPAGLSRWLRMDLPSRVGRMTEVPVTTVEAEA